MLNVVGLAGTVHLIFNVSQSHNFYVPSPVAIFSRVLLLSLPLQHVYLYSEVVDSALQFFAFLFKRFDVTGEAFDVLLVGGVLEGEPVISSFQVLDADLELFVNPEAGIVYFSKSRCLFGQVLTEKFNIIELC